MLQKVLTWGSLAIAVIAVFTEAIPMVPLILVLLGLIAGFMNPLEDVGTRVAYYVLAATLPMIANNLDAIPAIGGYLNGILDNVAITIAGIALANFALALYNNAMAAGSED
ncbi:MAG: hypothetical protein VX486_05340 [Pseudomonadota bacterium]|nr:hypothetical protein [Pseudomonadota bacterium]